MLLSGILLNVIIKKKIQQKLQRKPPSNDAEEEWMCIKETLIISAQDITLVNKDFGP